MDSYYYAPFLIANYNCSAESLYKNINLNRYFFWCFFYRLFCLFQ